MNGKPGTEKRAAEKPFLPNRLFPIKKEENAKEKLVTTFSQSVALKKLENHAIVFVIVRNLKNIWPYQNAKL